MRAFAIAASLAVLGLLGITSPAGADTKTYTAALSAAEETPTPGPAGGSGKATITIDLAAKTLCYDVTWSKEVGTPSAGHIHRGPKGLNGPIVVQFDLPARPKACLQVDGTVLSQLAGDPGGHYVNVHSSQYPNGAARGQLKEG
jgi:CHRD domain